MKRFEFCIASFLLATLFVTAAPCGGSSVQEKEKAYLMVDIQPLERALNFQFEKKEISKQRASRNQPRFEVEIVFEKPIYNGPNLIHRLMKLEPIPEEDQGNIDWDRRVIRTNNQITIYVFDQDDPKSIAELVIRHLEAMTAGYIQWTQNQLGIFHNRREVFGDYLQELTDKKDSTMRQCNYTSLQGMSVTDAEAMRLDLQRQLMSAEVDKASMYAKYNELRNSSSRGRDDAQRDRFREMELQAEADYRAIEERVASVTGKLRDVRQYIERKERAAGYQADMEDLQRFTERFDGWIGHLEQQLSPDGPLNMPQVVGDTVTIYEVEVVE